MSQIIEWINEKIISCENDRIDADDIDSIRDFALLWNLYEALYSNGNYSLGKALEDIIEKKDIFDENIIDPIFNYFYLRYQDSVKFNNLKFRDFRRSSADSEAKRELENMLRRSNGHSKRDKLYFIMAVVYRYRNNLFHGEKRIVKIRYQEKNFKCANQFLMHVIEKYKENNNL